jgi:hypothetical protein
LAVFDGLQTSTLSFSNLLNIFSYPFKRKEATRSEDESGSGNDSGGSGSRDEVVDDDVMIIERELSIAPEESDSGEEDSVAIVNGKGKGKENMQSVGQVNFDIFAIISADLPFKYDERAPSTSTRKIVYPQVPQSVFPSTFESYSKLPQNLSSTSTQNLRLSPTRVPIPTSPSPSKRVLDPRTPSPQALDGQFSTPANIQVAEFLQSKGNEPLNEFEMLGVASALRAGAMSTPRATSPRVMDGTPSAALLGTSTPNRFRNSPQRESPVPVRSSSLIVHPR